MKGITGIEIKRICAILLLTLFGHADGLYSCVNLTQAGETVIHENTTLVCDIDDPDHDLREFLIWSGPGGDVAVIDWRGGGTRIDVSDAYKYECQWDDDYQESVLTIKNTDINDDGAWQCYYRPPFCSPYYQRIEVNVIGECFIFTNLKNK